jgi:hypothetical protein
MNSENTIYTRILELKEIQSVIDKIPEFIRELVGDCIVSVEYGCGCNIHNDLQYIPMETGTSWLGRFISGSIEQKIFIPSKSDLSITTPDEEVTILFCHESDIHIFGKDQQLVEKVISHNLFRELIK